MHWFKFLPAAAFAACGIAVAQSLPPTPSVQLAVDPVRNKVYSANRDTNAVNALDAAAGTSTQILVGNGPDFIAVDPTRDRVFVNNTRDASLTVISGVANAVIAPYPIGSMGPLAINADPTGQHNVVFNVRMTTAASDEVTYFLPNTGGNPTWYTIATDSFQPNALAVNPATHTIYVTHYATGDLRIIDGTFNGNDFPHPPTLGMWSHPFAVVANPVTGKAYVVTEDSRGPIAVINSATSADFPAVTTGHAAGPRSILANPVTNKVYAAFRNEVIVIDGATNALTYIPINGAGSGNVVLGLNAVTNRIYAATELGTLNVINGDSNSLESSTAIAAGTSSIGINPITNTVYLYAGGAVTAMAGATGTPHTVPITTSITALPGNTTGPSGNFTLNASTAWPALPVRKVYYQFDSTAGSWTEAAVSGSAYTATFTGLAGGSHTLYAFAVDDQVAPLNTSPGSSPLTGAIASYAFTVSGSSSTPSVSLVSSANPSTAGQSITFTASVSGPSGTPTGSVTFLDGTAPICSNVAMSSGSATCATAALTAGSHSITARYSGSTTYSAATSGAITQTVKGTTSVSLSSSLNPSTSGQSVTFTAAVSGSLGAATGTVTFLDGTATLCASVAIASGSATCTTSSLSKGPHTITARYSGDATYASATSAAVTQNVVVTPIVGLESSANPSSAGQAVTFTANVAGSAGTPTGTVTFLDGTSAICASVALTSASASCTTGALSIGAHSISAQYSGDTNYAAATSITIAQNVNGNATVTLASSANPSSAGQSLTLTANVAGPSGQPTGNVTFLDGSTAICPNVALASGSAACTTSALAVGAHTLTARYSGNASYASATSAALTQTVKAAPNISIASTANPSATGQSVTFTASVGGSAGAATGTVTFQDGSTAICASVTLASGSASCTTSTLSAGPHSITAQYGGDANYAAATSSAFTQNVSGNVTVTLVSSVNPSNVGQSVAFTANVSGALGQPTGTVTFLDGSTAICSNVAMASGAATCNTAALAAGTHAVTARYSGSSTYSAATSGAVTQVVKAAATVALASSANPSTAGQSVTFTASVTGSAGATTGTVTFLDGSTTLCSVALASGAAACATSSLAAGVHSISAQYGGDAKYAAASSSVLSQSVNAAKVSATVALSSSANPSTAGAAVTFTAAVSGNAGAATGSVSFLDGASTIAGCAALPLASATASCSTSALASGSHNITVQYSGDARYDAAVSPALRQDVVAAKTTPTVSLSAAPASTVVGQSVTFTATVNASGPAATGSIAFFDGSAAIGGCTAISVSNGSAACSTSALAQGDHTIHAEYSGDASYTAAASTPLTVTVSPRPAVETADVSVSMQADRDTATAGKDVVFTITASNQGPDAATPVTVTAPLPAQAQYIWGSAACASDGARVSCDGGRLAAGQSVQFTLVLRPFAAGSLTVTASANAAQDSTPSNNQQSLTLSVVTPPPAKAVVRYRLYNPISLEHLYTTDLNEYNVLGAGGVWVQEGPVGKVLDNPGAFGGVTATPYYRLYNGFTLWHHWTTDPNEYYTLLTFPGWGGEGVDGYILPTTAPGATQLYRLVYPNGTGLHHWTVDANEYNTLISTYGWVGEGGAGFVIP